MRAPPAPDMPMPSSPAAVTLGPMEIRSFMCTTAPQAPTGTGDGPVMAVPWVEGAGSA